MTKPALLNIQEIYAIERGHDSNMGMEQATEGVQFAPPFKDILKIDNWMDSHVLYDWQFKGQLE